MASSLLSAALVLIQIIKLTDGECFGPQLKLLSDDPRQTCTEIFASKDRIEYACTSLIKGFPKAMIKYCPVEVCRKNGTWSKPSISCALSECYEEGNSRAYVGHRMCTSSGRQCQRWDTQDPQRHRFRKSEMFPDYSIQLADAFCRDPDGAKGVPWCFTTDPFKKWETCNIRKCSDIIVMDGSCGPLPPDSDGNDTGVGDGVEDKGEDDKAGENVDGKEDNKKKKKKKDGEGKGEVNKDDLKKDENDSTDSLQICSRDHELFQMQGDYEIHGNVITETKQRSVVQCATLCSQMSACHAISYRAITKACVLHGGKDFTMVENKGYRAGVKTCDL